MGNFFHKFFSVFRNGTSTKKATELEIPKQKIMEIAEWEEEEKIDSSILTEINSDLKSVIDSFKALSFNLLILNQDFRIVFVSDQFRKLTDLTLDSLIGKPLTQICPEPLSEQEKKDLSNENGAISTYKKINLSTGEHIPAQLYIQSITGLDETCYTMIVVPMGGRRSF